MATWWADRLSNLPPYLFAEIDRKKRAARAAGRDIIDFGVGDPDQPTLTFIVDRMAEAIRDPANHPYALGAGMLTFRQAAAEFYARRFSVALDPDREILALVGSKEGLGHLPTAVVNPGETVLVPDPGYPVYTAGALFAGGVPYAMPLREQTGWLPVLADIPRDVRRGARLMYLNYPNNPTAACAPLSFFEEAVAFAREHHLLIAQDAPYSELYYGDRPCSIMQVAGAKEVAVEFHSLSKTFNMTGWRVGFAVGNADALAALARVKNNLDSGVFQAVQHAAVTALRRADGPEVREQVSLYHRRRDALVAGLRGAGWSVTPPPATFFVWAKCPNGLDSMTVASRALDEADVVLIPGAGFGACGEGYVRLALTVSEERIREAAGRLARIRW
ncbi:MAG: LL-diaminopimelate aminotransferase [Planctomycetes bacterium]|nr:LL-diaminopimelate aminotransferase [Planctomycetota bacterium]